MRYVLCLALGLMAGSLSISASADSNAVAEETCRITGTDQVVTYTQFLNIAGAYARHQRHCVDVYSNRDSNGTQIDRSGVPLDDYELIHKDCTVLTCKFAD